MGTSGAHGLLESFKPVKKQGLIWPPPQRRNEQKLPLMAFDCLSLSKHVDIEQSNDVTEITKYAPMNELTMEIHLGELTTSQMCILL